MLQTLIHYQVREHTPFKSVQNGNQNKWYDANPGSDVRHNTLSGIHLVEDIGETGVEEYS